MNTSHIGKESVGKIAERIIANELEYRGFLVRDLNLERIAANVDLLAAKDGTMWQIQVKGSSYETKYPNNGWWFQYGYCKDEHIQDKNAKMFNRIKNSFQANIVALVCVRSPHECQCIFLPVEIAEQAAQINIDCSLRTKKLDGSNHRPGKVWFSFYPMEARTPEKKVGIIKEQELVKPFLIDRSHNIDRETREADESKSSGVLNKVFAFSESTVLTDSLGG